MNPVILLKQVGTLILYLITAFVLIHFLAVFGLFLALCLPLLHLFFYPKIICLSCKLRKTPHTGRHSILDGVLVLSLTLLSLPLLYGETKLISYLLTKQQIPLVANIAEFVIPTRSQYPVGTIFPLPLELKRIPSAINVAQADLSYDPNLIEAVDITTVDSFMHFFVQKEFDNQKGYVRVAGGVPNPGYSKSTGLIATIYFRTKQPGATQLKYLESSMVLANDGRGTNLLADYPPINILITPSNNPNNLVDNSIKINNQIQGDTDKTILSFSEYAGALPEPYHNIQGINITSPPLSPTSTLTTPTFLQRLLTLNQHILSRYQQLILH